MPVNQGGTLSKNIETGTLGSSERQAVKAQFKNFNEEFDNIIKTQRFFTIPDSELRKSIIKEINAILLPMYEKFLTRYKPSDFTKNPQKYYKYTKETLEATVGTLFTGS